MLTASVAAICHHTHHSIADQVPCAVPFIPSKMKMPYDPVIPLPGIHPKETKPLIRKDKLIFMFPAAPFTTAKTWVPSGLRTEERIMEL